MEKYKIDAEDALPYLNTFPYRDYLKHETRQITNKIKKHSEKMDYYKNKDFNEIVERETGSVRFLLNDLQVQF